MTEIVLKEFQGRAEELPFEHLVDVKAGFIHV